MNDYIDRRPGYDIIACAYHPRAPQLPDALKAMVAFSLYFGRFRERSPKLVPLYQVWRSTDSCGEFWSWDDCDEAEYLAAPESKRRILYGKASDQ